VYRQISDYGIIGNLQSIALVGLGGSIDWLCLPHIDSPTIFGALLDDRKGGRFSISPCDEYDSTAEYIPDTNILVTKFRTRKGILQITDFMPVHFAGSKESEEERPELYRLIEVTKGEVFVDVVIEPRFDYARTHTSLEKKNGAVFARGNGEVLKLSSPLDLLIKEDRAEARCRLTEGDRTWVHLKYGIDESSSADPQRMEKDFTDTKNFWRDWLRKSETGRPLNFGPYESMVNRSALVLKLLYYSPTGTIAAAATTSLPEEIGGLRNWDYRYTWVRDTSFTLQALFNLGHLSETEGYLHWVEKLLSAYGPERLQIMYGLRGEEELTEVELSHLEGYKGSRPVRVGNGAAKQKQMDIYGELMDAALKLSDYVGKIDFSLWPFLCGICNYVVKHWEDKDYGIWEARSEPRSYVYSKIMCWVALDRGITIARRYGFPGNLKVWEETREKIKGDVLKKGWSNEKQSFVQHYETDALDASNLLISHLGFLPGDDPRMISTCKAAESELGYKGFLYRYSTKDGLPGREGAFLICSFWLIDCLIAAGRLGEAESILKRLESTSNHLGLFSEEYDPDWKEALGNFPQALTHIGYVNSVIRLLQAQQKKTESLARKRKGVSLPDFLLGKRIVLNDGPPDPGISTEEIASRLKACMNLLRGAFFNTAEGRVAYEQMRNSPIYEEYRALSCSLKRLELKRFKGKREQLAFWINLYNVLVIHGVIELGIRDSVKEVRNFFKSVQYQISNLFFTPHDIEHGILRGNRRPPYSVFKMFRGNDERLTYRVTSIDPRIHFALVCASSSCPPIDIYTAENLDEELGISGRTFLNAGGVKIDKRRNRISLSRVFKWYGSDFGETESDILKFIAPYLYEEEDRKFIEKNLNTLEVGYQQYDWRLNRYQ
jgi:GH15 family glucan-1,4-alpha-glucosidase